VLIWRKGESSRNWLLAPLPGVDLQIWPTEREMCLWAISKYFGDLVSNTSALVLNGGQTTNQV
jgi:hypothetical protein